MRRHRRFHADTLSRLEALESLLDIVREASLPIDLRRAQNRYYHMRRAVRPAIEASSGSGHAARQWLRLFDALGEKLLIAPEITVPV